MSIDLPSWSVRRIIPPEQVRRYARGAHRSATGTPRPRGSGRDVCAGTLGAMTDGPRSHDARSPRTARPPRPLVRRQSRAALSLVIAAGSAYGFVAYQQARRRHGEIDDRSPPRPQRRRPASRVPDGPCAEDVCNYLLLGSDSRAGLSERGAARSSDTDQQIGGENRADTIMLVHTDPALEKAIIVSFPRDLWVEHPGPAGEDKINAAFEGGIEGGGAELVAETVQDAHRPEDRSRAVRGPRRVPGGRSTTLGGVDMCITGENVNTPGYVETETADGDDRPDLLRGAGLHRRSADRARHRSPDARRFPAIRRWPTCGPGISSATARRPDFYRIQRQQQFMRAVINRLLQPEQLAQLPFHDQADPGRTSGGTRTSNPADLAYPHGAAPGHRRPGRPSSGRFPALPRPSNLAVILRMDPVGRAHLRCDPARASSWATVGRSACYTPPSEATVPVLVVDHASAGKVAGVQQIVSRRRVRHLARTDDLRRVREEGAR